MANIVKEQMILIALSLLIISGCYSAPNPVKTSAPPDEQPRKAGLFNSDGTEHVLLIPNPVKGRTLNVIEYGADPLDNGKDDRPAIQKAFDAAQSGDEIYFPKGVYNLKSPHPTNKNTHLQLKSNVNVRGESQEETILESDFNNRLGENGSSSLSSSNSTVIDASSVKDIVISTLTISSSWNSPYPTDHKQNSEFRGGPKTGINIDKTGSGASPSNIIVSQVIVEKFERMGIRISQSHDVVVDSSVLRKATDMGGGGSGYGVAIIGTPEFHSSGKEGDSSFNIVQNSFFDGTVALRHGALLGYATHNNAIRSNNFLKTRIDSIDLHGDNEYLNEIYNNTVIGTQKGAGIGLGNTGGTPPNSHSASGPFNYIHDNVIRNAMDGIVVIMGTPDTVIEHNVIEAVSGETDNPPFRNGITIKHALRTIVNNNVIRNQTKSKSLGILLTHDSGDINNHHLGEGDPQDTQITGNTIVGHAEGIKVESGTGIINRDNTFTE